MKTNSPFKQKRFFLIIPDIIYFHHISLKLLMLYLGPGSVFGGGICPKLPKWMDKKNVKIQSFTCKSLISECILRIIANAPDHPQLG